MRFIIKDRSTRAEIVVQQPNNQKQRESLAALIKHTSRLGMRGKCLEEIA